MVHFVEPTKRLIFFLVACFCAAIPAQIAFAQVPDESGIGAGRDVAFVYVSTRTGTNTQTIEGFTASATGGLTPNNLPLHTDYWGGMASNGQFLFGADGIYIFSFAIEPGGGLRKVATRNARHYNGAACGGPSWLFLDRTGTTLYDLDDYGNQCANNTYQSFSIESTGNLEYVGTTSAASPIFATPLSFLGNNSAGFGATCYHYSAAVYGLVRASNGSLSLALTPAPLPSPPSENFYCTFLAAADASNHVAVSVQQLSESSWLPTGPPQIAVYTGGLSGKLLTKSTYSNMPKVNVNSVYDLKASPSGKLLAVAGSAGLQILHFNGAAPVSRYTGLLTTDEVDQMFWDKSNHLYAISRATSKLYVFTLTPTSVSQAAGSPYSIANLAAIAVVPTI